MKLLKRPGFGTPSVTQDPVLKASGKRCTDCKFCDECGRGANSAHRAQFSNEMRPQRRDGEVTMLFHGGQPVRLLAGSSRRERCGPSENSSGVSLSAALLGSPIRPSCAGNWGLWLSGFLASEIPRLPAGQARISPRVTRHGTDSGFLRAAHSEIRRANFVASAGGSKTGYEML